MNYFKTSDIKISTDSMGNITANHKFQGLLIDSTPFWADTMTEARAMGRRAAVEALNELKLEQTLTVTEQEEIEPANTADQIAEWLRANPEIGVLNSGKYYKHVDGEYTEVEALAA